MNQRFIKRLFHNRFVGPPPLQILQASLAATVYARGGRASETVPDKEPEAGDAMEASREQRCRNATHVVDAGRRSMARLQPARRGFEIGSKVIFLSWIALGLLLTLPVRAVDKKDKHEKGPFELRANQIGKLLKLSFRNNHLQIDRDHWEVPFNGKTEEELLAKIKKSLARRGHTGKWLDRLAEQQMNKPAVDRLFDELCAVTTGGVSRRTLSSRSTNRIQRFSGGGIDAMLMFKDQYLKVILQEESPPGRSMDIRDDGKGRLEIAIYGRHAEKFLQIAQAPSGRIKIILINHDEVMQFSEDSFLVFYQKHFEFVRDHFFPFLRQAGLQLPLSPDQPEVKKAVLLRLHPLSGEESQEAVQLLKQLDDDDFHKRESASKILSEKAVRYWSMIVKEAGRSDISAEVQTRINAILKQYAAEKNMEQFIADLKLLKDPGYLIGLLNDAEESEYVLSALKVLTGHSLGNDVQVWQSWWQNEQSLKKDNK